MDFSYARMMKIVELGTEFGLFRFQKGYYNNKTKKKKASRLWLRDVAEWRIFDNQSLENVLSMVLNIETIGHNGRNKDPRAEAMKDDLRPAFHVDKSRDIDGNAVPIDKRRKNYEDRQYNWMWAAPEEFRAEVEYINSGIPEALRPLMSYTRIFGTSIDRGGRLWGSFQYLKKNLRQVIYDRFGLEELDFDGFNLNLFFLLETGSKYGGDVYTDIMARMGIIGVGEQRAYRPIFKQLVLTIFGVESRTDAVGSFVKSLTEFGVWWDKKWDKRKCIDMMERWRAYLRDEGLAPDTRRLRLYVDDLIETVEDVCSPIRKHLFRRLTDFAQNVESRVIVEIGKHMVADGLLPLLIHDALVVPQEFAQKYDALKEQTLLREIGREKNQKPRDEEIERSQIA